MKRLIIFVLCLVILSSPLVALASDVSNAKYLTTIQISNNGSAVTNGVVVLALSATDMITAGMLGAAATDAAVTTHTGGTDVAFQPSVNGTTSWPIFVSSIGASSNINRYLYSLNVTGGDIHFFPPADGWGIHVVDHASMEPSSNYTIEVKGFLDVTAAANKWIMLKDAAMSIYVSPLNSGNVSANVTTTGVSIAGLTSGEATIRNISDGTNRWLQIVTGSGTFTSANLSAAVVPNTATDWYFGYNAMPYIEYVKVYVGGTLKFYFEGWHYSATYTDASGFGNTPIMAFRTTSTAGLSATVLSQEGLLEASTPVSTSSDAFAPSWSSSSPSGLFTEGGDTYGFADFHIGENVTSAANTAGQDPTSWHIILAFALACAAAVGAYKVTHSIKLGQKGSLFISCLCAEGVLIYFYIMGTIPGFSLIPFGLMSLLLIVWRKSPAPVD